MEVIVKIDLVTLVFRWSVVDIALPLLIIEESANQPGTRADRRSEAGIAGHGANDRPSRGTYRATAYRARCRGVAAGSQRHASGQEKTHPYELHDSAS
jgi:hypothetical protein